MSKNRPSLLLRNAIPLWVLLCHCAYAANDETLYLTVSVNGQPVKGFVKAKNIDNKLYISANDAKKLDIKTASLPENQGFFDLSAQDGLDVTFDNLSQNINIVASKAWLGRDSRLANRNGSHLIHTSQLSPEVRGLALNYNAFTRHENGEQEASLFSELRTFGLGPGFFSTSFNSQNSTNAADSERGTHRLMSSWVYQNVDKLFSMTLGDSFTSSQSWNNSVRFGGINIAHNYSTQPNFSTSSQDILTDSVTLPSTVDLYVRGVKTSSQRVDPGQFTLNTAPIFTGNEGAQVVITDINGQQRVVNLDLYGATQLLSDGLNTWGISAGWVRKDYTYTSFSYDSEFVGVGDWRYGVSNKSTLGLHTEQSASLHNQGAGWDYLLSPTLGVLHANASNSRYGQESGTQWGSGWQWNNRRFNVALNHSQASRGYRDVSSLADNTLTTREDSAFTSVTVDAVGTFGISWVNQTYPDASSQYVGLSWSRSFTHQITLATSLTRELGDDRNTTVYLNFSMPLNQNKDYLSLQDSHDNAGNAIQASLSHSLDANKPGWGWNMSAQSGDNAALHATVQHRNHWSDMALGLNRQDNNSDYYGSMSGALGLFMGHLYATRMLGSAFAIVDTSNVPDVPVYLEHRPVGHTDKNGMLFLNNLNAYQENRLDIDVLQLDEAYRAPYTGEVLIPKAASGALAKFTIYKTQALLMTVKTIDGKAVPFSAQVNVLTAAGEAPAHGTQHTIAGYEGKIYLEDPPTGGHVEVKWAASSCQVMLPQRLHPTHSVETINALCQSLAQ
ncbi:fimbria/pilus outer membrane usher protein [Kluyvera sp. CHPC 1.251]|uniref:fimbria/pilus outer membrane usher protein n=1 Tax=Kluyvera sp. CHPC 1.251 TaxID=2995175 RepID=UPI002FD83CE8